MEQNKKSINGTGRLTGFVRLSVLTLAVLGLTSIGTPAAAQSTIDLRSPDSANTGINVAALTGKNEQARFALGFGTESSPDWEGGHMEPGDAPPSTGYKPGSGYGGSPRDDGSEADSAWEGGDLL